MAKRKQRYQWKRALALVLVVSMAVGMAPTTVYAAPDENTWNTEADTAPQTVDESATEAGDADIDKSEDGTGQDSESAEAKEPAGTEDAGSTEPEEPAGTEDTGSTEPEEPAGAEDAGNAEPEEPSGTEDAGNAEPEEPAGMEDAGNAEPEEPASAEDAGNAEPEDSAGTEDIETEEPEVSLSGNALSNDAAVQAEDAGDIIASGTGAEGATITWTLYKSGELVVEGTGDFRNTNGDGVVYVPWKDYADRIISATVKVTGADSANMMFYNCINLTSVDLTGFDTANVTNMYGMFYGCKSLTSADLSGLHTENVTTMENMFASCSALETLNLSGLHAENAVNMDSMFENCSALKTLDLSGFKTEKVQYMSSMFADCKALNALDLSGFNTQNAFNMNNMFRGCSALTALNLSSFDTVETAGFSSMFSGCSALETLDISSFTISSESNVDGILQDCGELKEIKTPKQAGKSIQLPETDGIYSWRTEDGTKVTELPAAAATVSIGKKIGISFTGSHFTLKEFEGKKIEEIDKVFDKGGKESFTFTIVPEEGYNAIPEVKVITDFTRITVTQGADSPYQYIVAPKDAEQGYLRDEVISISVVKSEKHTLYFPYSLYRDINYNKLKSPIYEAVVVVNGEEETDLTEKLLQGSASIEVSNEFDTTLYMKVPEKLNAGKRIPVIDIYEDSPLYSRDVRGEIQVDSPTETDKKYEQEGYCAIRLGRIYNSNTKIRWLSPESPAASKYSVHLTTEGLPEDCHVVGYLKDGYRIGELEDDATIEVGVGEDFYVRIKWTDTQDAYRWCRFQVRKRPQGYQTKWTVVDDIRTVPGIEGEVYYIGSNEHIDLQVSLLPHEISLGYIEGDLMNLTAGEGTKLTEDEKKLEVYSGDSPSVRFGLNEKLTLNGISVTGENGVDLTDQNLVSLQDGGNNKWTLTFTDTSRLYDITGIQFAVKDELERISLADSVNEVRVFGNFNNNYNGTKCVYIGQPIYGKNVSVRVNGEKLTEGTDYTISYRNNINVGKAEMIVRAAADSTKYRGEYTKNFTIEKASPFNIPEIQVNIDANLPEINLPERIVINAPYDRNVKPTGYEVMSCDPGGILAGEDAETMPVGIFERYTLVCFLREDADRDSEPAKVVLAATMQNYEDTAFTLKIHLVKREQLILEGVLTEDKVYDGRAAYPDVSRLQIPYKFPYLENPKEGEAVNPEAVSAEEAAKIRERISGTLTYHYTGIDGTVYDDYEPPVDVGTYKLQVKVAEENEYYKSDYFDVGTFQITPRDAVLTAEDVTLYLNDTIPARYGYTVSGLARNDVVSAEPAVSCAAVNTALIGEYPIQINVADVRIANAAGKDVTADYRITGTAGTFHVVEAKAGSCTVTFDLLGKGADIRRSGIEAGSLISRPADPTAAGYVFLGWYVDETFSKMWNFAADTIQGDTRLYAGWSSEEDADLELHVREIRPQTYTGKALKPAIDVYAADGKTLLKKNKDYTIAYKNNVDADTKKFSGKTIPEGGIGSGAEDTEEGFDPGLAYVIITGKGNYKGTVYMNFHITPADISGAGSTGSAMTLKYTESFEAKNGKNAAIVTQLKSKTATLKYGRDYALTVKKTDGTAVSLTDKGQLPLNAGAYKLTIEGKDNYTGSVEKDLYVASKGQLIKNAKIKCAGAVSDVTKEQLKEGIRPQNLEVTLYGTPLTEGTDFEVICTGNHAIGTATVTVKGIGAYFGSKSAAFKIKGIAFKEKEFEPINVQDMTYTGTAQSQNDVALAKNGVKLTYGEDYTISYKNNIKKGRATMTFKANPASGYSGSFKKTFKINPLSLDSEDILLDGAEKKPGENGWTLSESVPYQKGGATPVGELTVKLRASKAVLTTGKDYSVKYKNNKDVSNGTAYMTLTGKGNFTGSVTVYFDIRKASLSELYEEKRVTITAKSMKAGMSYSKRWDSEIEDWDKTLKDPDYRFQPAVTVKDGKKALKKDEDFRVTYTGNVRSQLEGGGGTPQAMIIGIGNYSGTFNTEDQPVTIPLSIYNTVLSGSKVYVVYDVNTDYTYTGKPIMPKVTVYYGKAADVSRAKRNGETDESVLIRDTEDMEPEEAYGLTKLQEYAGGSGDYILSYGANTVKGKTGKVIIRGVYDYSGSVTSTFTIDPKEIYTIYEEPDPEE